MVRSRSGNRARVLHYMLGLAGIPSRMALVRSASGDSVPSNMADGDTYEHLLVTYEDGEAAGLAVHRSSATRRSATSRRCLRGQPALLARSRRAEDRRARRGEAASGPAPAHARRHARQGRQRARRSRRNVARHRRGLVARPARRASRARARSSASKKNTSRGCCPAHVSTKLHISGREQEAESSSSSTRSTCRARAPRRHRAGRCRPMLASAPVADLRAARRSARPTSWSRCRSTSRSPARALAQGHRAPEHGRARCGCKPRSTAGRAYDDTRFDQSRRRHLVIERRLDMPLMRVAKQRLCGLCELLPHGGSCRGQRSAVQLP